MSPRLESGSSRKAWGLCARDPLPKDLGNLHMKTVQRGRSSSSLCAENVETCHELKEYNSPPAGQITILDSACDDTQGNLDAMLREFLRTHPSDMSLRRRTVTERNWYPYHNRYGNAEDNSIYQKLQGPPLWGFMGNA